VKPDDPRPARLCRFCGKSEEDVRQLMTTGDAAIPENTICDECVGLFAEVLAGRASTAPPAESFCTFCGKKESEVRRLIASESHIADFWGAGGMPGHRARSRVPPRILPHVAICDECVDLCRTIIESDAPKE
jgi:ATP-dependent protease Clp ATPase subunit